ncbi:MAG TPA: hypothetical protein VLT84_04305 [Acidobacteriota bacterium]|nr:hypothetical protein [Acidobacteriota bacterium]
MLVYVAITIVAALVVVFIIRAIQSQGAASVALKQSTAALGFQPCPDEKGRLEEIVAKLEGNPQFRYQVEKPQRRGNDSIYFYVKRRDAHDEQHSIAEEEFLFPLKRRTAAGLMLVVKPTAIGSGLASKMLGSLATGDYDAQPAGLKRIEIPSDLAGTNIIGAMGEPGHGLHDLVDPRVLTAVQGVGDAGGLIVMFRDEWCSIASTSRQLPFKPEAVLACVEAMRRG